MGKAKKLARKLERKSKPKPKPKAKPKKKAPAKPKGITRDLLLKVIDKLGASAADDGANIVVARFNLPPFAINIASGEVSDIPPPLPQGAPTADNHVDETKVA